MPKGIYARTPEHGAKIGATLRGRKLPEQTRRKVSAANTTHGRSGTPTYQAWSVMKRRCANPNASGYDRFGGRGVTVCERWLGSFENFLADMGEKPPGASLVLIDDSVPFGPGNCRWSDTRPPSPQED